MSGEVTYIPKDCSHEFRLLETCETIFWDGSGDHTVDLFYCTRCLMYQHRWREDYADTIEEDHAQRK
ncbi:hypothetical protein [Nitrolancea hollandica]|uniref:Uncharacterized protein n=1 Tax=Nitrolancea hollandica Lb TaxID=1129897 RepID=I4EFL0_9BACT|nr:hypothetical protein [Nitrolancea hollandica]CCF83472.1 hypothetical protein NITHO_2310015 [Nitrolancea hollandica Lb]